jgi:hypothetical protein
MDYTNKLKLFVMKGGYFAGNEEKSPGGAPGERVKQYQSWNSWFEFIRQPLSSHQTITL